MSENNETAVTKAPVLAGEKGLVIKSIDDAYRVATMVAESGLAPKGMNTPAQIMVAIQTGQELGFTPMRALQSVVVVNGRATLMGEAALALIRGSGKLEPGCDITCGVVVNDGVQTGFCRSRRRGGQWQESFFDENDAKKAGLWGKSGPWSQYPKRMLMWRAVAFHTRDFWSDVTHGLMTSDEAIDVEYQRHEKAPETPPQGARTGKSDPLMVGVVQREAVYSEWIEPEIVEAAPIPDEQAGPDEEIGDDVCPRCLKHAIEPKFQNICDACLIEEEDGGDGSREG